MNIKNSTALVTGANRGIGAALVQALLKAGAKKIYATARDKSTLGPLTSLEPARVVPVTLDVTSAESLSALSLAAPDVDLVINNAGILSFGSILDATTDSIVAQFETNFYGPLNVVKALLPEMEKRGGGAIVNVLTLLSMVSAPGMAGYNASKAAAWSMTQSLRASLAGRGFRVFSVFPGAVDTEMLAGVEIDKTSPEDVARALIQGVQAGDEDIFPDPMATAVYSSWKEDHKAVERQFAAM